MIKTADGKWVSRDGTPYFECKITRKPCTGVHAGMFQASVTVKAGAKRIPIQLPFPPHFVCRVEAIEAMIAIIGEMTMENVAKNRQCEAIPGAPVLVEFKWLYLSAPDEETLSDGRGNPIPKNRPKDPREGGEGEGQGLGLGQGGEPGGTPPERGGSGEGTTPEASAGEAGPPAGPGPGEPAGDGGAEGPRGPMRLVPRQDD